MISEMIEKLQAEAKKEADAKAYCDKEMATTEASLEEKNGEVDDLTTKKDSSEAHAAKLTEDIATLQSELAAIAAEQKEATDMRQKGAAAWKKAKADYDAGLEGVGMALQVLRDYYAAKDEAL